MAERVLKTKEVKKQKTEKNIIIDPTATEPKKVKKPKKTY
jgi:hypothetical protein